MRSALGVVCIVGVLSACDPIQHIEVSHVLAAPLSEPCTIQALRSADQVGRADVSADGIVYADLRVPAGFEEFESRLHFQVQEELNSSGELVLVFSMGWVGERASQEYREFAEKTMHDVQELVVGRCGDAIEIDRS